jgi:hypothetical protein
MWSLLVGGWEHVLWLSIQLGIINPNWRTPSFLRGVGWNHQQDYIHGDLLRFLNRILLDGLQIPCSICSRPGVPRHRVGASDACGFTRKFQLVTSEFSLWGNQQWISQGDNIQENYIPHMCLMVGTKKKWTNTTVFQNSMLDGHIGWGCMYACTSDKAENKT